MQLLSPSLRANIIASLADGLLRSARNDSFELPRESSE
jgi:hypothetical protein